MYLVVTMTDYNWITYKIIGTEKDCLWAAGHLKFTLENDFKGVNVCITKWKKHKDCQNGDLYVNAVIPSRGVND